MEKKMTNLTEKKPKELFEIGLNTATASVQLKKDFTVKDIRAIQKFIGAMLDRKARINND
jgi:hypothetical protein